MNDKIRHLRQEYALSTLLEGEHDLDPIHQFKKWFDEALSAELPEPHAMTLATVSAAGKPSIRVVLLRNFDAEGFVFFTNYKSKKGGDAAHNPNVALNFFWQQIERQVRIEGCIEKINVGESEAYFNSRPRESQIGAWASLQSMEIESRATLEEQVQFYTKKYEGVPIPCPPHWGGYRVVPEYFEFWQGRPSRLHDRISYTLKNGSWLISRLNP